MSEDDDEVWIQLKEHVDRNKPVLRAVVTSWLRNTSTIKQVRVVSEHPVWRGCPLGREQFHLIEE